MGKSWLSAQARNLASKYVYWKRQVYAKLLRKFSRAYARSVYGPLKKGDLISTTIIERAGPEVFYASAATVVSRPGSHPPGYVTRLTT